MIEALEPRALLSVTSDDQGWTNFTHGPQARTVYVSSSSGNDNNSGLASSRPVKTLAKARSLLRDGSGDWMLLRCGDVWFETLRGWTKSGKSKDEPLLISSYGKGERPVLQTGDLSGFSLLTTRPVKHVAVVGLLFHANTRDPDSPDFQSTKGGYGVDTMSPLDDLLVENCVFDAYEYNLSIRGHYGPASHVGLRRNVVVDAYSTSGKSEGLYMSHVNSVLIEGNVFDHNGWNEKIPAAHATLYTHNIYLDESNTSVFVRDNIIADAGSHGLQARGGGTITGNVFLRNPIGLLFGNGSFARSGGVEGNVSSNVFLGTADISGMHRGWAMEIANTRPGGKTVVANNVFANDTQRHYPAIIINGGNAQTVGVNDLTLTGNIVYRWQQALQISGSLVPGKIGRNGLNGLVVQNNDFQRVFSNRIVEQGQPIDLAAEQFVGNRYYNTGTSAEWFRRGGKNTSWAQWNASVDKTSRVMKVNYDDPWRTIESYNAMLGGKPRQGAFLTRARMLSRRIWDPRYSAAAVVTYIRTGFTAHRIPPTVKATNLISTNTRPTSRQITFIFSKDVGSKLTVDSLIVFNRRTRKRINSSAMQLQYDPATHTATWSFPGLTAGRLAGGDYRVTLLAGDVVDARGTKLDGDANGAAGGNFERRLRIPGGN